MVQKISKKGDTWQAWGIYKSPESFSYLSEYGDRISEVDLGDDWEDIPTKEDLLSFLMQESKRAGCDLVNGLWKVLFRRNIEIWHVEEDGTEEYDFTDVEEDYVYMHISRYEYPEFIEEDID